MGLMPDGEPVFLDPEPLKDPQSATELFGPSPALNGSAPEPVAEETPCAECADKQVKAERIAMAVGVTIGAIAAGAVFWFLVKKAN
jgi:hypothetical protein